MITPSIGRFVLVFGLSSSDQPTPAVITYVWDERMINVGGFDASGNPVKATSVPLMQPEDAVPTAPVYATWMDYQIEQAAKSSATVAAPKRSIAKTPPPDAPVEEVPAA